ncbi:MAG: aminotransferase class III-fold pyridoxal phosphate-dependent enzyme, partial [Rhodothermales bacterium]
AIARKVIEILNTGTYQARARRLGAYLFERLDGLRASDKVKEIRGRGLWVGIELYPEAGPAKDYCKKLMAEGMLCKDTNEQTMRLAPPLCITRDELDWAVERLYKVLS